MSTIQDIIDASATLSNAEAAFATADAALDAANASVEALIVTESDAALSARNVYETARSTARGVTGWGPIFEAQQDAEFTRDTARGVLKDAMAEWDGEF